MIRFYVKVLTDKDGDRQVVLYKEGQFSIPTCILSDTEAIRLSDDINEALDEDE